MLQGEAVPPAPSSTQPFTSTPAPSQLHPCIILGTVQATKKQLPSQTWAATNHCIAHPIPKAFPGSPQILPAAPALLTPSSCWHRRGRGCCRGSPRPHGCRWLRSRCCAPTHSCCSTQTSAPQRASWSPTAWGWAAPPPP